MTRTFIAIAAAKSRGEDERRPLPERFAYRDGEMVILPAESSVEFERRKRLEDQRRKEDT